eukprot:9085342-Prorocentrum_lima.AAC.1
MYSLILSQGTRALMIISAVNQVSKARSRASEGLGLFCSGVFFMQDFDVGRAPSGGAVKASICLS